MSTTTGFKSIADEFDGVSVEHVCYDGSPRLRFKDSVRVARVMGRFATAGYVVCHVDFDGRTIRFLPEEEA
jgi:hypothetical protein